MDNLPESNLRMSDIRRNKKIIFVVFLSIFFFILYFLFILPPSDFPVGTILNIEPGTSLRGVSLELKNNHIIRSRTAFEAFVILLGRERRVVSASYYFETSLPVYEVANRIAKGEHHIAPVSVTIPEGFNSLEIADLFTSKLPDFDKNKFLAEAVTKEGYLFPDTYFFLITDTEAEVLKAMSKNFENKMKPILPSIIAKGKTERQIITMASIVEKEAKGDSDRGVIAGILWKRIGLNMPLQVDAAPETYKVKGLPKSPVANPGLEAIQATISPQSSPYLYYLHDKDGNIHYARTFDEHVKNRLKYLPKQK